tara:strand:- start:116 stop:253 length:138 start_codon:yes stop_codon:yes gene_type:complete
LELQVNYLVENIGFPVEAVVEMEQVDIKERAVLEVAVVELIMVVV